jgi:hypothetical protein
MRILLRQCSFDRMVGLHLFLTLAVKTKAPVLQRPSGEDLIVLLRYGGDMDMIW